MKFKVPLINILILFFFSVPVFAGNLIRFKINGFYGLMNKDFKVIQEPTFRTLVDCGNYYLAIDKFNQKTAFDANGKKLIYGKITSINAVSKDHFQYSVGSYPSEIFYIYNVQTKQEVFIKDVGFLTNQQNDAPYFVSDRGTVYLPNFKQTKNDLFEKYTTVYPFYENRAVVLTISPEVNMQFPFSVIDSEGNLIADKISDTAERFSEGLLAVQFSFENRGFIDKEGRFFRINEKFEYFDTNKKEPCILSEFKNGYCIIRNLDNSYAFIDKNFNKINFPSELKPEAMLFCDNLILVSTLKNNEKKYGFMGTDGSIKFECIYDKADSFENGYSRVYLNGKHALLDTLGNLFYTKDLINKE